MVRNSLAELARRTGHPELTTAPFLSVGYSRFSAFAAQGVHQQFPGRVIAHINGFGPNTREVTDRVREPMATWTESPSLFLATEFEDTYGVADSLRIENMTTRPWQRFNGLLRGMCLTRGTRHNPFNAHELAAVFFDQAIRARVPADWDPQSGAPTLLPIAEADGWLGDNDVYTNIEREITGEDELVPAIAPFADYTGDRHSASWLPTRATAFVWRGFSMGRPLATVIGPSHPGLPKGPTGQVLHLEHNLRADIPFLVTARSEAEDIVQIDVFANDQELGSITEFSGGEMSIGNTTHATGTAEVRLPAGVYGIMLRYTRASGRVGWSRPALITVFPRDL